MAAALKIHDPSQQSMQSLLDRRERHKALGDWFQGITSSIHVVRKALGEQVGSNGGYLVPEQLLTGVDAFLMERCLFHRRGFLVPMLSETCNVGTVDLTVANAAGESPLFGGMTMAFQQEGITLANTVPAFDQARLTAKNLQNQVIVSNQMVQDGGAQLGAYLESIFCRMILWTVERNCFVGNGVTQPMGLTNAPGTVVVARSVAANVSQSDLTHMMGSLLPASYENAVWACSVSAIVQLADMADFVVNEGETQHNLVGHIYGRPLYVTENLPTLGTQGDVLLFDPSLYLLGERYIEVAASPEVLFATNQTVYRIIWRGDGLPLVRNTCLAADGATTVGAYVALGDVA